MKRCMTTAAIVVACLSLAACAQPHVFDKPGASRQQFYQAKLQCTQIASSTSGDQLAFGPLLFVAAAAAAQEQKKQGVFDDCMQADGWTMRIVGQPQ